MGAGMMGRAIAAAHVEHQLPVVISDSNEAVLAEAVASIADLTARAASRIQSASGLICAAADMAEAARCDLVLESIVETLPAKQRLEGKSCLKDDAAVRPLAAPEAPDDSIRSAKERRIEGADGR